MTHPITPPPELVQQWASTQAFDIAPAWMLNDVATQAAQWGADQELEACCEWIPDYCPWDADHLRAARRPKPPSLKEQALDALSAVAHYTQNQRQNLDTIRRALEALDD